MNTKKTVLFYLCVVGLLSTQLFYAQDYKKLDSILNAASNHIYINPDETVKICEKVIKAAGDNVDYKVKGLKLISDAYSSKRDYKQSLDYLIKALELLNQSNDQLLKINITNKLGIQYHQLKVYDKAIQYLGFPFSISENFQMRNTHKTIAESLITLQEILEIADKSNKEVVTYISMGFGNPYGDPYNVDVVGDWTEKLAKMGVKILSLSDTIGSSTPEIIDYLFRNLIPKYPNIEFGAHLHTTPDKWFEKIDAAYNAGCRRYDGAIQGFGGCPMAKDDLTGNMPTEKLLSYFTTKRENTNTSPMSFESAYNEATKLFGEFH